jgi:hypothetical protein
LDDNRKKRHSAVSSTTLPFLESHSNPFQNDVMEFAAHSLNATPRNSSHIASGRQSSYGRYRPEALGLSARRAGSGGGFDLVGAPKVVVAAK